MRKSIASSLLCLLSSGCISPDTGFKPKDGDTSLSDDLDGLSSDAPSESIGELDGTTEVGPEADAGDEASDALAPADATLAGSDSDHATDTDQDSTGLEGDVVGEDTLEPMSDATPETTPDAVQDAIAETTLDTTAETMLDTTAETTPDTTAETAVDSVQDTTADTEAVNETSAEVTADTGIAGEVDSAADSEVTTATCATGPGPCCDETTGELRAQGFVCDPDGSVEFDCEGQSLCGALLKKRARATLCSGTSSSCDGRHGSWGEWTELWVCDEDERCSEGAGDCEGGTADCDVGNAGYCAAQLDFERCDDQDDARAYDICLAGSCRSPGCGTRDCNPSGPGHVVVAGAPTFVTSDPAGNGEVVSVDSHTGLWWPKVLLSDTYKWADALEYCEDLELAGESDWRMPDCHELGTIIDWQRLRPALNPAAFSGQTSSSVWSSCSTLGGSALAINTEDGSVRRVSMTIGIYAWCVRGEPTPSFGPPRPRFVIEGASTGIVRDNATGLRWQRADDGLSKPLLVAIPYCESLSLDGVDSWRLPHVDELWSLLDASKTQEPFIDSAFQIAEDTGIFGTATQPPSASIGMTWKVSFRLGTRQPDSSSTLIKCVADP